VRLVPKKKYSENKGPCQPKRVGLGLFCFVLRLSISNRKCVSVGSVGAKPPLSLGGPLKGPAPKRGVREILSGPVFSGIDHVKGFLLRMVFGGLLLGIHQGIIHGQVTSRRRGGAPTGFPGSREMFRGGLLSFFFICLRTTK
jgi:hypothetical protein